MVQSFRKITSLAILILILWIPSVSQQQSQTSKIKVNLIVGAPDIIANRIISNLNKHLRTLGDVLLVNDNSDFNIHIVAVEAKDASGMRLGYAFSTVVTQPIEKEALQTVFDNLFDYYTLHENLKETLVNPKDAFKHQIDGFELILFQIAASGFEINELCEDIVVNIDVNVFEKHRKEYQK